MTNDRDARGARAPARRRGAAPARGGRPLALGGRLDRRHERHARGDDPPALVVRRRRVARPRADADAGDPDPARGGDPRLRARAVLARRRAPSRPTSARRYEGRFHAGAKPRIAHRRGGRGDRRARSAASRGDDHQAREDQAHREARRCSTTSRRCSARPTRASASPRAGRSAPRSAATRSTRRSPTRARARAS